MTLFTHNDHLVSYSYQFSRDSQVEPAVRCCGKSICILQQQVRRQHEKLLRSGCEFHNQRISCSDQLKVVVSLFFGADFRDRGQVEHIRAYLRPEGQTRHRRPELVGAQDRLDRLMSSLDCGLRSPFGALYNNTI
jgi:hypothetical protein